MQRRPARRVATAAAVLASIVATASAAAPARADLIGTSVTGSLTFGTTTGTNYYDPAAGYVPTAGFENAAGPTVPISASAVEHCTHRLLLLPRRP